jgi:hypothetical protein
VGVVGVGPEQDGELVPAVPAAGGGQVGEQRDRLAGVDPQRRPADRGQRCAEQGQPESGHAILPSGTSRWEVIAVDTAPRQGGATWDRREVFAVTVRRNAAGTMPR